MSIFSQSNNHSHNSLLDASYDIIYLESLLMLEEESAYIENNLLEATHLGIIDNNPDILIEGFKDFVNNVKELIQKFINYIKTAISKFFMHITSLTKGFKKFIDDNKEAVLKKDISFEFAGFQYTIDEGVPNIKPIEDLIDEYNKLVIDIKSKRVDDIKEEEAKFYSKLPDIRNKVLDLQKISLLDKHVEDYEFNDICVKRFRNGFSVPTAINVDNTYIQNIIRDYDRLEKSLSSTKKSYEKVMAQLNNLKSFFEKRVIRLYDEKNMKMKIQPLSNTSFSPEEGDYLDYDTDAYAVLNAFMDLAFKQVKVIGSLITTAFYEKINAINANIKQYTEIFKHAVAL